MNETMPDASAEIDRLGRGELDPQSSLWIVRAAFAGDEALAHRLYTGFRNLVWRLLVERDFETNLPEWHALITQGVALSRKRKYLATAERLHALGELVSQSARYTEHRAGTSILQRKHVLELLSLLSNESAAVPRVELAKRMRLAEANLSRILTLLASNGLVKRTQSGKEAAFRLTDAGQRAIESSVDGGGDVRVRLSAIPMPIAVWDASGSCTAFNRQFSHVSERMNLAPVQELSRGEWTAAIKRMAVEVVGTAAKGSFEVRLPDNQWIYCSTALDGDTEVCSLTDLTEVKARQSLLESQIDELRSRLSKRELDFANLSHRAVIYGSAVRQVREDVMEVAAHANRDLHEYMNLDLHADIKPQNLVVLGRHLSAAATTASELLWVPELPWLNRDKLVYDYVDIRHVIRTTLENFRWLRNLDFDLDLDAAIPDRAPAPIGAALAKFLYSAVGNYHAHDATRWTLKTSLDGHSRLVFNLLRTATALPEIGPHRHLVWDHHPNPGPWGDLLKELGAELKQSDGLEGQSLQMDLPLHLYATE